MCTYSSSTPAAACRQYRNVGISNSEKTAIVNKHNELRQKVASGGEERGNPGPQPPAVHMPNLEWDDELATVAQRWTNQCNFRHDACRDVDRYQVGQNLAKMSSSGEITSDVEGLIQLWYDEVDKFDKNKVSKYEFDVNTGHYTQVIWAGTTKIGCGRIIYKESNGWTSEYLACNYGPSGNFQGQPIYEVRK